MCTFFYLRFSIMLRLYESFYTLFDCLVHNRLIRLTRKKTPSCVRDNQSDEIFIELKNQLMTVSILRYTDE